MSLLSLSSLYPGNGGGIADSLTGTRTLVATALNEIGT
jgi:hypothetical protein